MNEVQEQPSHLNQSDINDVEERTCPIHHRRKPAWMLFLGIMSLKGNEEDELRHYSFDLSEVNDFVFFCFYIQ